MSTHAPVTPDPTAFSDEWCAHHFDHFAPGMGEAIHEVMAKMRADQPVAWSDQHGGFWLVTRYEDVLRVAQDAETFSSAKGISVPYQESEFTVIPIMTDPPEHRGYRRLINRFFTPAFIQRYEASTRATITALIDDFVESGRCEFMDAFARPLPGTVFFDSVIHAPASDRIRLNELAIVGADLRYPEAEAARQELGAWIVGFMEQRRAEPRVADVIDAILHDTIDDEPVGLMEAIGMIMILLFGGLDTTAGMLGNIMVRFCREPGIPAYLREHPERINAAVEEMLRLDTPQVLIGRYANRDAEVGGQQIKAGDRLLICWTSANHDEAEFACPEAFDLDRESNRHITFGAGIHRCAGSNLARTNLRLSVAELLRRLPDLRFQEGAEPIPYHSVFTRFPERVPIAFTPGVREG